MRILPTGASWRIKITPPPPDSGGRVGNQQVVALPPIGVGKRSSAANGHRTAVKSAILQASTVDVQHDAATALKSDRGGGSVDGAAAAAGKDDKPKVRLTLWRLEVLVGSVELDVGLKVHRADAIAGLIMGRPSAYLLKHPLHRQARNFQAAEYFTLTFAC